MTRLNGNICAVTGASSGIGEAIARGLAAEGARVVALARRFPERAATPPAPGEVLGVHLDVTDEAAVDARFAEIASAPPAESTGTESGAGGIDVLVCSAGVGYFAPFATASAADLRAMLDVHVIGSFLCCRAALRSMAPRRRGHILTVGSIATRTTFPECAGYTAAKLGQLGLTRVLAEEMRAHDVRVTAISPGAVDTPIWDDRPGFDRSRMMRPDDLAALVIEIIARPGLSVDEIAVVPPGGNL